MRFTKCILQDIRPHVVNHGILTKWSSLIHLYSIFFFFFYNSLTIKQLSTKSFTWNHEINKTETDTEKRQWSYHSWFILVSVYIPPDARVSAALELLADQITHTEQRYPDSFIVILGDFNKANLTRELPKYRQHITCPTRDSNILDHCYTVLKDAYHSVPRAALGLSDHCLVHLLPAYRQKLKSSKPILRTVKRWTAEAEQDLQACFELTDWSVFEAAATDLDELTDTVTSYISFCEDMCIPTRTYLTFNNDKPWFSTKLKQLRLAKEDTYRSGDKALYKQAKYTLNREIRVAKKNYAGKLKKQLSSNDPTSVWKGLKAITSYKTPPPSTEANQQLTEDLNSFYCRFQKQKPGLTPHTHSDHPTTQPSTPSPSLPLLFLSL